jgi:electron transfer flavoprotein beta subunit
MKAKKKPLDTLAITELGIELQDRVRLVKAEPPIPRQKGIIVKTAAELVAALKQKGLLS